jgi:hypothetical protein
MKRLAECAVCLFALCLAVGLGSAVGSFMAVLFLWGASR